MENNSKYLALHFKLKVKIQMVLGKEVEGVWGEQRQRMPKKLYQNTLMQAVPFTHIQSNMEKIKMKSKEPMYLFRPSI